MPTSSSAVAAPQAARGGSAALPAIDVAGIGKRYFISHAVRPVYDRLGESLTRFFRRANEPADTREIWALEDVSFEVHRGEVVGLIGRNGAGKSTLLKILSRITEPTTGHADLRGRVGSLLEVGTGFHPDLTGIENIYMNGAILGMRRADIRRKLDEILAFAEIEKFANTPVKFYSSGMYVRLAFAVAAHNEPDILMVDEVLAVGDAAFQQKCIGKMSEVASHGRTVIFVSHSMSAISRLCNRGIVLEGGRVRYQGEITESIARYNELVFGGDQSTITRQPHVLFEEGVEDQHDFALTRVELLTPDGQPYPVLHTWDSVIFRFHIRAREHMRRAAVHFELRTADGTRVIELSTQPDGNVPLSIAPGHHFVDLLIRKLPLAAGDYVMTAGLTVPMIEWIWHQPDMAGLTVHPRDVYDSGRAPALPRTLVPVDHEWRL